jgi:hypothetical protein
MENPPRVFEYASSPFQVPPGQKTASSFGKTRRAAADKGSLSRLDLA